MYKRYINAIIIIIIIPGSYLITQKYVYHKTSLSSNEGSAVEFREKIPRDKKSKQTNKQKQPKKNFWLSWSLNSDYLYAK